MEIRNIQPSELESARRLLIVAGWDRGVADGVQSEVAMERPGRRAR